MRKVRVVVLTVAALCMGVSGGEELLADAVRRGKAEIVAADGEDGEDGNITEIEEWARVRGLDLFGPDNGDDDDEIDFELEALCRSQAEEDEDGFWPDSGKLRNGRFTTVDGTPR